MTPATIRQTILELVHEYHGARFGDKAFDPARDAVHYAGRVFDSDEMVALVDASLDFFLTAGRYADRFEEDFAKYLGLNHAMLVNSGSSANLVALSALTSPRLKDQRLCPGDEVLTVACGFPTTLNPILQNQLVPVFVDVNLCDYTAIPERLALAIGPKTKAIMMAHTLGVPFDLGAVTYLAESHNLWLIEDNCDALGSQYHDRLTGTFGQLSTFSFYPAHHMTMGEGGCVATDDDELARIARSLRDWGRDCHCKGGENGMCGDRYGKQFGSLPVGYDHKYVTSHIGYNLKVTEMQAAIGCAQLNKIDKFTDIRKENFRRLYAIMEPYRDRLILPRALAHSDPSWFGFAITVRPDAGFTRNEFTRHLEADRIETRNLFAGNLLRHPAYEGIPARVVGDLRNSDLVMTNTFFIGVYPGIGDAQLDYIQASVDNFMRGRR